MSVLSLVRPDLQQFTLYTPADSDDQAVRLHANELPWRDDDDASSRGLNRYPQPRDRHLRERLADLYGVASRQVLPTRGSDDGIDLLIRTFCRAGRDRILTTSPGFSMYGACARLQGCATDTIALSSDNDFALAADALLDRITPDSKLVFLCSPNNPHGGLLEQDTLDTVCRALAGRAVVVVDEAYAEFTTAPSAVALLGSHDNLVVLRTLSKAYGLAGARIGAIVADAPVITTLNQLLTPYPLPTPCVDAALRATTAQRVTLRKAQWARLMGERERLADALIALPIVRRVWPSAANFLLTRMRDAPATVALCRERGYLVRDLGSALDNGVRVTIGTPAQNDGLLYVLGGLS